MNRTGSGVSIHLQDEDIRIRTLPEAEGTLRMESYMEKDAARMQLECSGRAQG